MPQDSTGLAALPNRQPAMPANLGHQQDFSPFDINPYFGNNNNFEFDPMTALSLQTLARMAAVPPGKQRAFAEYNKVLSQTNNHMDNQMLPQRFPSPTVNNKQQAVLRPCGISAPELGFVDARMDDRMCRDYNNDTNHMQPCGQPHPDKMLNKQFGQQVFNPNPMPMHSSQVTTPFYQHPQQDGRFDMFQIPAKGNGNIGHCFPTGPHNPLKRGGNPHIRRHGNDRDGDVTDQEATPLLGKNFLDSLNDHPPRRKLSCDSEETRPTGCQANPTRYSPPQQMSPRKVQSPRGVSPRMPDGSSTNPNFPNGNFPNSQSYESPLFAGMRGSPNMSQQQLPEGFYPSSPMPPQVSPTFSAKTVQRHQNVTIDSAPDMRHFSITTNQDESTPKFLQEVWDTIMPNPQPIQVDQHNRMGPQLAPNGPPKPQFPLPQENGSPPKRKPPRRSQVPPGLGIPQTRSPTSLSENDPRSASRDGTSTRPFIHRDNKSPRPASPRRGGQDGGRRGKPFAWNNSRGAPRSKKLSHNNHPKGLDLHSDNSGSSPESPSRHSDSSRRSRSHKYPRSSIRDRDFGDKSEQSSKGSKRQSDRMGDGSRSRDEGSPKMGMGQPIKIRPKIKPIPMISKARQQKRLRQRQQKAERGKRQMNNSSANGGSSPRNSQKDSHSKLTKYPVSPPPRIKPAGRSPQAPPATPPRRKFTPSTSVSKIQPRTPPRARGNGAPRSPSKRTSAKRPQTTPAKALSPSKQPLPPTLILPQRAESPRSSRRRSDRSNNGTQKDIPMSRSRRTTNSYRQLQQTNKPTVVELQYSEKPTADCVPVIQQKTRRKKNTAPLAEPRMADDPPAVAPAPDVGTKSRTAANRPVPMVSTKKKVPPAGKPPQPAAIVASPISEIDENSCSSNNAFHALTTLMDNNESETSSDEDERNGTSSPPQGTDSDSGRGNSTDRRQGDSVDQSGERVGSDVSDHDDTGKGSGFKFESSLWRCSEEEEKENIKKFWKNLKESQRQSLMQVSKQSILDILQRQQKIEICTCAVCQKRRSLALTEIDILYDQFYWELNNDNFGNIDSHISCDRDDELNLKVRAGIRKTSDELLRQEGRVFLEMMEKMANKKLHADGKASDMDSAHRCQLKDEQSSTAELVSNDSAGEDTVSPRKPLLQYLEKSRSEGCTAADAAEVQDSSTASGATSISGCDEDNYTSSDCQINNVPRDPYDQGTHKGLCCECANCFPRLTPIGRITTQDIKLSGKVPPNPQRSHSLEQKQLNLATEQDKTYSKHRSVDDVPPPADDYEETSQYSDDESLSDEERLEEARRMFQMAAAKLFHQRVLKAYLEKISQQRQEVLLLELDAEEARKERQRLRRRERKKNMRIKKAKRKAEAKRGPGL